MSKARFIYDNSNTNSDLYYATRFLAPDPFVYFDVKGKSYILVDTLEYDRAKRTASVDKVLLVSDFRSAFEMRKGGPKDVAELLAFVFKKFGITELLVPGNFPLALADSLRKYKFKFEIGPKPFFFERTSKTKAEKKEIIEVQKKVFKLIDFVRDIIADSKIKGDKLIYQGEPLTSERIHEEAQIAGIKMGLITNDAFIFSSGIHAIDPHDIGSGPIKPHQSIIVDIFPKSAKTFFCGDATRTFCKGKASPELKRMHQVVKEGQEMAIDHIAAGLNGFDIHKSIVSYFESKGYKSGMINGKMQGFIHGTGHGIGLDAHENPPFIAAKDCILNEGGVVSVEPGLYYKGIGGVRIEDLIYIKKGGCEVLSGYPKILEVE